MERSIASDVPFRRLILGRRDVCVRLDSGTAVETVYLII